jgi:arabinofuranosyltransferase
MSAEGKQIVESHLIPLKRDMKQTLILCLERRGVQLTLLGISILLFIYIFFLNAWVVDDAYITFRTMDNFLHGYGLRWNIDERVQVYTHPLWLFVMTVFSLITSKVFYTSILVSFLCSLGAICLAGLMLTNRICKDLWKASLLVIALCSSKAFIDYTSSGLENALSYFIAALFCASWISFAAAPPEVKRRSFKLLFFLASLAFVNRMDTLLLYLPALVCAAIAVRSLGPRWLVRHVLISTLPATLWVLFSMVYYGFPFPNTAYAKVTSTGFPMSWKLARGLDYLSNSLSWDSLSYLFILLAMIGCIKKRDAATGYLLGGVCLYFFFIMFSAGAATHMSGRFLALPLFVAIVLCVYNLARVRYAIVLVGVCVLFAIWSPVSAIKFGTSAYGSQKQDPSCIDTKWFVYREGAALIDWRPNRILPDHAWYHYGEGVRNTPNKVHVGGAFGAEAIGYVGYAAGPSKFIVDKVGLGDPLLARLPAIQPDTASRWKSGHFHRTIPAGYLESVERDTNVIQEQGLHDYYDKIRVITRGRVFSWERLKTIVHMNLGDYDSLVASRANGGREGGLH